MQFAGRLVALVLLYLSGEHAVGGEFLYGWGTEMEELCSVPETSPLSQSIPDCRLSIHFRWNQLWFGLPFWISDTGYVVKVVYPEQAPEFLILNEQNPEALAALAGVSPDVLTRPFFSRFPFGYVFAVGGLIVAKMLSGPSPRKRYLRVISDQRYLDALRLIVHRQLDFISKETGRTENSTTEADAPEPAVVKNNLEEWYAEAIQWLIARGISENVAHRNLQFLMEYLDKHPHDAPPLLTNTTTK
ncbi:MAG: hypothetical protein JNL58_04900 [Planctomyces sp.]|nr:hypothetical protein [Planctomyces sp.]